MDFLQTLERKGILEQMSRVRRSCKEIYDLARVTGRAIHNPLEGLSRFLQSKPAENYAHVTAKELPELLRAIRTYPHALDLRLEQTLCLARSAVNWSSYPNAEPPIPEFVAESERRPEPLLRALGLAAHLIAELGGELDQNEQLVSRRRRYTRGGSPNITTISKALANTATKLRHDGHNFQGAGFEKLLRQALKEIE